MRISNINGCNGLGICLFVCSEVFLLLKDVYSLREFSLYNFLLRWTLSCWKQNFCKHNTISNKIETPYTTTLKIPTFKLYTNLILYTKSLNDLSYQQSSYQLIQVCQIMIDNEAGIHVCFILRVY
jgi:hypothetical protein